MAPRCKDVSIRQRQEYAGLSVQTISIRATIVMTANQQIGRNKEMQRPPNPEQICARK